MDVVAPGFGFVEIEMLAVGDQAYMKFSKDAPWAPLPPGPGALQFRRDRRYFERCAFRDKGRIHRRTRVRAGHSEHSHRGNHCL